MKEADRRVYALVRLIELYYANQTGTVTVRDVIGEVSCALYMVLERAEERNGNGRSESLDTARYP